MTETNRIGSTCWYKQADIKIHRGQGDADWRAGVLRAWSTDYDDDEHGPALFPVAVIEDIATGKCSSVYVTRVCFSDTIPNE